MSIDASNLSKAIENIGTDDLKMLDEVRKTLTLAYEDGREDAGFFLGKSYEISGDYGSAERYYEYGFKAKYRASVYRLATLHGKGLLEKNDTEFYHATIKVLAKEGHIPSMAQLNGERVKGSYGIWQRCVGLFLGPFIVVYAGIKWFSGKDSWRFDC